jgi:hypothetical protein
MISTYVQGRFLGAIDALQANGLGMVSPVNGGQIVARAATGVAGTGLGSLGSLSGRISLAPTNVTYSIEGFEGASGTTGIQGGFGPQGVQGIPGASISGPQGQMGSQGPVGPMGPRGQQGAKGDQGVQGIKGDDGEVDYSTVLDLIKSSGILRATYGANAYAGIESIALAVASGTTSITMSNGKGYIGNDGFWVRDDPETFVNWLVKMNINGVVAGVDDYYCYNGMSLNGGGFSTFWFDWEISGAILVPEESEVNITVEWEIQNRYGPGTATPATFIDACNVVTIGVLR